MDKLKSYYVCKNCGLKSSKWSGCCPNCGSWNTLEEKMSHQSNSVAETLNSDNSSRSLSDINSDVSVRYKTNIDELDRLLGGGIVKGSLILIGGDPGIGKSTLLLQICSEICIDKKVLYVSGEESANQIKLRADRLNINSDNLFIYSETDLNNILAEIRATEPSLIMIDSIQTMTLPDIGSYAGSVTQVRETAGMLQQIAKHTNTPVFIVGHVNKDGNIAGPKVLEHIVDTVLYFEGDSHFTFRILRAVKNRYGSTNEIAVFQMEHDGLKPIFNPSALLLEERPKGVSGSCVCSIMEGTRPILAEVQALVTKSGFATPRRMSTGFDYNRMSLIIAVLEKRAGYSFGTLDCYINVIGGIKLDEPGADLPIALSLVSSLYDMPIDDTLLAFGEIGLAGEIRSVNSVDKRVLEAKRLGFKKVLVPKRCLSGKTLLKKDNELEIVPVYSIKDAIRYCFSKKK